jgi:hypothetical protein
MRQVGGVSDGTSGHRLLSLRSLCLRNHFVNVTSETGSGGILLRVVDVLLEISLLSNKQLGFDSNAYNWQINSKAISGNFKFFCGVTKGLPGVHLEAIFSINARF